MHTMRCAIGKPRLFVKLAAMACMAALCVAGTVWSASASARNPGATPAAADAGPVVLYGRAQGGLPITANGFEMGTANDRYVELSGPIDNGSDYTVSFWARPDKTAMDEHKWGGFVICNRNTVDNTFDFQITYSSASDWRLVVGHGTTRTRAVHPRVLHNEWQHVAGVVDSASMTATVYVNGEPGNAVKLGGMPNNEVVTKAYIGTNWSGGNSPDTKYHGDLKLMHFYRRALTKQEVAALYRKEKEGKPLEREAMTGSIVLTGTALRIGWASADITPKGPVVMSGGRRARISAGVMDPIGVTALVLESVSVGQDGSKSAALVAQVAVELSSLREDVMDFVLQEMRERVPEIEPEALIIYATHTHAAPDSRPAPDLAEKLAALGIETPPEWTWWGMDLGVRPTPREYARFVARRVVDAVEQALKNREPGGVSFGLGHAVVGHNRLIRYDSGRSQMYGRANRPDFSHVEGYEDHSVGLLYTFDARGDLTGVAINMACPAQVTEGGRLISADFWHETREELRRRLGESLHVLPQIAAAGDQSPHLLVDSRAEERMQRIMFPDLKSGRGSPGRRQQIAVRIADAVTSVLPFMKEHIDRNPVLTHRAEQVELTRLRLTDKQVEQYRQRFETLLADYVRLRREIEENPERKQKAGWQNDITPVYWNLRQAYRVIARYERKDSTIAVPVHVVRIGDLAIATNPFELYLDFGMQIKARSKAVQTFTIQLSNGGYGYLPTKRSVSGGAYGAIPTSNSVGPEGGRELVEWTVELIGELWSK